MDHVVEPSGKASAKRANESFGGSEGAKSIRGSRASMEISEALA